MAATLPLWRNSNWIRSNFNILVESATPISNPGHARIAATVNLFFFSSNDKHPTTSAVHTMNELIQWNKVHNWMLTMGCVWLLCKSWNLRTSFAAQWCSRSVFNSECKCSPIQSQSTSSWLSRGSRPGQQSWLSRSLYSMRLAPIQHPQIYSLHNFWLRSLNDLRIKEIELF